MAFQFPDKPFDGQTVDVPQPNGSEFVYTYNEALNTWELAGQGVDLDQNNLVIFTDNVFARGSRPLASVRNTTYKETRSDEAFEAIANQQDINWALKDAIDLVEGSVSVWVSDSPPTDDKYVFWWNTDTLELLFKYNEQWWPVSIPPAQAELLRQEIDALYQDTATNRLNIAITQQELDLKVLETKERIDEVEATANSAAKKGQENTFTQTNTFAKDLIVDPPFNVTQPFIIKGKTEGANNTSNIFFSFNQTAGTAVRYRGLMDHDDCMINKGYVDSTVSSGVSQSTSNCAFLNKDNGFASNKLNTFYGPVVHKSKTTIDPPGNTSTSNTFEIKGTDPGGTVNQTIFSAKNVIQQNGAKRMEVLYNGANYSSNSIATVGYVQNAYISRADHDAVINALTLRIAALEGGT